MLLEFGHGNFLLAFPIEIHVKILLVSMKTGMGSQIYLEQDLRQTLRLSCISCSLSTVAFIAFADVFWHSVDRMEVHRLS